MDVVGPEAWGPDMRALAREAWGRLRADPLWAVLAYALIGLLIVWALATEVAAEPPRCKQFSGDMCILRPSSLGHPAEFYYLNSADRTSLGVVAQEYVLGDVTIRVTIEARAGQTEILTIESDEYFPSPPIVEVEDGQSVVVQIVKDIM